MRTFVKASSFIVLTFVLCLWLLTPQLCRADNVSSGTLNFQTQNQSMWGSGPQTTLTYNPTLFDVPIGINQNFGPGLSCPFGICIGGYTINTSMSGDIGANANLAINGGSVKATVPVNVSLGFPGSAPNGAPVSITSSATFGFGSLATASPNAVFSLGLFANLNGGITGTVCDVAGCASGGPTFHMGGQTTLFTIDSSNIPPQTIPLGQFAQLTVSSPFVATSGATPPQNFPPDLSISSSGSSPFLGLAGNISNIVSAGLGDPILPSGSFGWTVGGATLASINYDIFKITAGLGLNMTQAFDLTAAPLVSYSVTGVGNNSQTFSSGPMIVGTPYTFSIPTGDTAVSVTPTYMLSANLNNNTGGSLSVDLGLQALELQANLGKIVSLGQVGPLLNETASFPFADFSLYNNTFALQGWNTIQGAPFEIAATNPTAAVPEPPTLLLMGAGLLLMTCLLRHRNQAKVLGHQV